MTTKITVDAHAGWPVKVTLVQLDEKGYPGEPREETVPPNTTRDFYVHSHLELHVKEMPNTPAAQPTT